MNVDGVNFDNVLPVMVKVALFFVKSILDIYLMLI